jgi:Ca2+-binding RTX toxin-like protein
LGNDVISGGAGTDVIEADAGNDTLSGGDGNDALLPGVGDDSVDGGNGIDAVSYPDITGTGVTVDLRTTTAQNTGGGGTDTITTTENAAGSNLGDSLTGTNTANTLVGRGGDDTLSGQDGNDYLEGDAGTDTGDGGLGFDTCVTIETRISCEGGTSPIARPASASALTAESQFRATLRQWDRMAGEAQGLTGADQTSAPVTSIGQVGVNIRL